MSKERQFSPELLEAEKETKKEISSITNKFNERIDQFIGFKEQFLKLKNKKQELENKMGVEIRNERKLEKPWVKPSEGKPSSELEEFNNLENTLTNIHINYENLKNEIKKENILPKKTKRELLVKMENEIEYLNNRIVYVSADTLMNEIKKDDGEKLSDFFNKDIEKMTKKKTPTTLINNTEHNTDSLKDAVNLAAKQTENPKDADRKEITYIIGNPTILNT